MGPTPYSQVDQSPTNNPAFNFQCAIVQLRLVLDHQGALAKEDAIALLNVAEAVADFLDDPTACGCDRCLAALRVARDGLTETVLPI